MNCFSLLLFNKNSILAYSNLTADGTPFRFGMDADGNYGYIVTDEAGADSVIPFKSGGTIKRVTLGSAFYPSSKSYKYDISGYVKDISQITSSNFVAVLSNVSSYDRSATGYEKFSCSISYAAPNVTFTVSSDQSGEHENRALSCSCNFEFFYILN